jgi:hypothetical protein
MDSNIDLNIFKDLILALVKDCRITVWHMGTMMGIMLLATENNLSASINISRRKVMERGHINNFVTYHKCIKELQEFGYIRYEPSYHPAYGSKIFIRIPLRRLSF